MEMNYYYLFIVAAIPLLTGWVWYSNILFGNAWMKSAGIGVTEIGKRNMLLIFLLTYISGLFIASILMPVVIHQFGIYSVLQNQAELKNPQSDLSKYVADFMSKYGQNFRTFKHGAFHGTILGLMFAMPIVGINAMFENKNFKYVAIHTGYWMLTLAIMGGIICANL